VKIAINCFSRSKEGFFQKPYLLPKLYRQLLYRGEFYMKKRFLTMLLAVVMVIGLLPQMARTVSAKSASEITALLQTLEESWPAGTSKEPYPEDANGDRIAYTCYAWGRYVNSYLFGVAITKDGQTVHGDVSKLKIGDFVRYPTSSSKPSGHNITVTGFSGDYVIYTDKNHSGDNKVYWNQKIHKDDLQALVDNTFVPNDKGKYFAGVDGTFRNKQGFILTNDNNTSSPWQGSGGSTQPKVTQPPSGDVVNPPGNLRGNNLAPDLSRAVVTANFGSPITLTWTRPANATRYRVHLIKWNGATWVVDRLFDEFSSTSSTISRTYNNLPVGWWGLRVTGGTTSKWSSNFAQWGAVSITDPHTHSYSRGYDSAHPHREYDGCSCGTRSYLNTYRYVSTCAECNPPGQPTNVSISPGVNPGLGSGLGNNIGRGDSINTHLK